MINPKTGEQVTKEQQEKWIESREAAHVKHLLLENTKEFNRSFEASFNEVFNND